MTKEITKAITALQKQVDKYHDEIVHLTAKSEMAQNTIKYNRAQVDMISKQILALKGESSVETLTDVSKNLK